MPPTKQPEKPTLRAVETSPAAPRVHPLFPALRTYPATVRVYRMERDGSSELLETMPAADLDPGVEPLAVNQNLARAALRVSFGPGVYRVQGVSEGGGMLGSPQRVAINETDDDQRPHAPPPRAPATAGPSPLAQSVDAAVTTTTARGLVDELRASAARSADASNNQVAAMAAMMQSQMQSQATLFGTVLQTIAGNQSRGTDPVLLEILRERGTNNQALLDSNQKLRDELAEMRRLHSVAELKGVDPVTKKVLELVDGFAIKMAAKHDAAAEEHAAGAQEPRPQLPPPAAPKPPTVLESIAAHPSVDPAEIDMSELAESLDRASRGEMVAGDHPRVLLAGVLARDGMLPAELHPKLAVVLIKVGGARVRSKPAQ